MSKIVIHKKDLPGPHAVLASADILGLACHGAAYNAGWWHNPNTGDERTRDLGDRSGILEMSACLLNVVAEIAEAWEGVRKSNPRSEKIPQFSQAEEEIADAIIRLFDTGEAFNLDIAKAISAKMEYNANRKDHKPEERAKKEGKKI